MRASYHSSLQHWRKRLKLNMFSLICMEGTEVHVTTLTKPLTLWKHPMALCQWGLNLQHTTVQQLRQTYSPAHPTPSPIMTNAAAFTAARYGPIQHLKRIPYCTETSDLPLWLGPLTPVWPGEAEVKAEVVKAWPLFRPVSEVSGLSWGQEFDLWASGVIENCWPPRQATWPCLPLELSLVQDPVAVAYPSAARLE